MLSIQNHETKIHRFIHFYARDLHAGRLGEGIEQHKTIQKYTKINLHSSSVEVATHALYPEPPESRPFDARARYHHATTIDQ